jgi:ribosome-associated protein
MAKSSQPRGKRSEPARRTGAARRPRLPSQLTKAIAAASDKKASAIMVLDLRKTGAFTDYFLICTGANPRQVHAIADGIEAALKAIKVRPAHVEGYSRAEWILLDYFDFIVHVFSPHARQFYGLERLWGEATRIEISDEATAETHAGA